MKRLFGLLAFLLVALPCGARADLIKQGSTYTRMVYMQDSTQSRSPGVAGLTLAISASKAGGAFAAITPTVTDLGGGWYSLALTGTHTNTLNAFAMKITATGADETDTLDQIVAFDPTDASLLGLTGVATLANQTSNATAVAAINTKLGAPAGASVSADIAAIPAAVWANGTRTLTAQSDSAGVTTLLTRLSQALLFDGSGNVKANVAAYTSLQDPATIVWGATASSYNVALTMGNKVNSAASAGDPWSTALPGSYGAGTAGNIVGNRLDAAVSSRMATFSLPTNFSALAVDSSGRVTVGGYATGQSPKEQVVNLAIPGENGLTFGQALYNSFLQTAGKFGAPVRSTGAPWTISVPFVRASDGATVFTYVTTYTDNTFSKTLSRSYTTGSLPSP